MKGKKRSCRQDNNDICGDGAEGPEPYSTYLIHFGGFVHPAKRSIIGNVIRFGGVLPAVRGIQNIHLVAFKRRQIL